MASPASLCDWMAWARWQHDGRDIAPCWMASAFWSRTARGWIGSGDAQLCGLLWPCAPTSGGRPTEYNGHAEHHHGHQ